jgi:4-amino-4-deoxy-L-arabinose transferase-like glycosyltransferase
MPKRLSLDSILLGVAICAILVFAFVVRVYRIDFGLPYLYYWDEPQTAGTALQMLKTGTLNPHFFNYGSLPIYIAYFVDIFHYLFLMGQPESANAYMTNLSEIKTWADTQFGWTISHPSFYYWNRFVNVLFGLGSIALTYQISNVLFNKKWVAVISAFFLASTASHVEYSTIISPDMPVVFFVLAVTLCSLEFLNKGKTKYLILSLVFSGCAMATKYNSALVIMLPSLVVFIRLLTNRRNFEGKWLVMVPLIPTATFFVCMPYAFMDSASFLSSLGYELRHYKVYGHGGDTSVPGIRHIRFQFQAIIANIGVMGIVISSFGLLAITKNPKLLVVILFPLAYFFYMTTMKVNVHRNFILIYPYIAILYGAALGITFSGVRWLVLRLKIVAGQDGVKLRLLCLILPLVLTVYAGQMASTEWHKALQLKNSHDSRSTLVDRINALNNVPMVFIPKEIRIHEQDLRRLKHPYKIVSLETLFECTDIKNGSVAIVPERVEQGGPTDEPLAFFYQKAIAEVKMSDSLLQAGSGITRLSYFSVDPKLFVFDAQRLAKCDANTSSK